MNSDIAFAPDYVIPPGEIRGEYLHSLRMTQRDLSVRTGLTPKSINATPLPAMPGDDSPLARVRLSTRSVFQLRRFTIAFQVADHARSTRRDPASADDSAAES